MNIHDQAAKEKSRIALISILAAVFLTSFKLLIGFATGSLGILSEALHSGLDLVAALITFFAVRAAETSAKPTPLYLFNVLSAPPTSQVPETVS